MSSKISDQYRLGKSAADIPEEWFDLPVGADLNDPVISAFAYQKVIYYDDIGRDDLEAEYAHYLVTNAEGLPSTLRASLIVTIMLHELINSDTYEETEKLYTSELKKQLYLPPLKNSAHVKLFHCAYAHLVLKDEQDANEEIEQFRILQEQQLLQRDRYSVERSYERLLQKISGQNFAQPTSLSIRKFSS